MTGFPRLIGHDTTLSPLFAAARDARLPQSLLFSGPSGVGKATAARQIAATAICLDPDVTARPCGQCANCHAVLQDEHPDVITLRPPATSKRGDIAIEAIRQLIHTAELARFNSRNRFFIIDPAESLTTPAANALLKTLEEPKQGTVFILITAALDRLLPTIRSRCQLIRFHAVDRPSLQAFAEQRGLTDPEHLARLAGGSPARVLELADGALEVHATHLRDLATALAGDLGGIHAFSRTYADPRPTTLAVIALLEDLVHDALLVATQMPDPMFYPELTQALEPWASQLWPRGFDRAMQALSDARVAIDLNVSRALVLEATLLRLITELGNQARTSLASGSLQT